MDRRPAVDDDRLLRRTVELIATSPLDGPLLMLDGVGAGRDRRRPARAVAGALWRLIRRAAIDGVAAFISNWLQRRADLRYLQSLDDYMLKDIGVSHCDVEREIDAGWFRK
jgi:uncharacterized protein YjiS (DUF1127 family)